LAYGLADGSTCLQDTETGQIIHRLRDDAYIKPAPNPDCAISTILSSVNTRFITTVAFSQDSTLLATGSYGGAVDLWAIESGKLLKRFHVCGKITSIAISPDNTYLAVGTGSYPFFIPSWESHSFNDRIHIWNIKTECYKTFCYYPQREGAVTALAFAPADIQVNIPAYQPYATLLAFSLETSKAIYIMDIEHQKQIFEN